MNYKNSFEYAKNHDKSFFNSKYESMTDSRDEEIACRHCFLQDKNIDYTCFQKFSVMNKQIDRDIYKVINNRYELRNYHILKKLRSSTESECLANPTATNNHDLFFDENLGSASTLFQNSIFGIKNVDGFGDCGILSIVLPILSSSVYIQNEIYNKMHEYHKTKDNFTDDIAKDDFLQ